LHSRYFQILPRFVEEQRKTAAQRRIIDLDQAAQELAQWGSNCGRATKDESGHWVPVIDEEFELSAEEREAPDEAWANAGF